MPVYKKIVLLFRKYFDLLNMNSKVAKNIDKLVEKEPGRETPFWIHGMLFIITFFTTTFAGSQPSDTFLASMAKGLPFSLTIMSILLAHEMGHYLAAKKFKVKATLPYFIPFPSIIGTMGAVIKIKSAISSKRALLYIGAMGPIVGFILSLIATTAGIYLSEVKPLPATGNMEIPIFGSSLLFEFITRIFHGEIPAGNDIYLHPLAWAGWIGFLVTSLNLMPLGQLDGSHILYSLIGRKQLYLGWMFFFGLVVLSFIWVGWAVWIALALLFLMIGHPPMQDNRPLTKHEKIIGWSCAVIFILTFIPVPVRFL